MAEIYDHFRRQIMIGIYKIDWDEVMKMARLLARQLSGKRIWGIPRGGQIVASIMAYHGCELAQFASEAEVIIDDIADTGTTLFRRTHNTSLRVMSLPTATLVVRNGCLTPPNHYIVQLYTTDYILFPWETEQEHIDFMNAHYKGEQSEQQ